MTTVWLFLPRSHGRKKTVTRAHNGAPLPGRTPSFFENGWPKLFYRKIVTWWHYA